MIVSCLSSSSFLKKGGSAKLNSQSIIKNLSTDPVSSQEVLSKIESQTSIINKEENVENSKKPSEESQKSTIHNGESENETNRVDSGQTTQLSVNKSGDPFTGNRVSGKSIVSPNKIFKAQVYISEKGLSIFKNVDKIQTCFSYTGLETNLVLTAKKSNNSNNQQVTLSISTEAATNPPRGTNIYRNDNFPQDQFPVILRLNDQGALELKGKNGSGNLFWLCDPLNRGNTLKASTDQFQENEILKQNQYILSSNYQWKLLLDSNGVLKLFNGNNIYKEYTPNPSSTTQNKEYYARLQATDGNFVVYQRDKNSTTQGIPVLSTNKLFGNSAGSKITLTNEGVLEIFDGNNSKQWNSKDFNITP